MKVLSLLQPWASLVVMGHKKLETRSWNTKYRGMLLIHASVGKKGVNSVLNGCADDLDDNLFSIGMAKYDYPFGSIIGAVKVEDTFQFSAQAIDQLMAYRGGKNPWIPYRPDGNDFESLDEGDEWLVNIYREHAFGDYSPGRYGWLLSDPVMFADPIPCKGSLSIWNLPAELEDKVYHQLHTDLIYEQELPQDITPSEYTEWFKTSKVVHGVRMGRRL